MRPPVQNVLVPEAIEAFSAAAREAVHQVIALRRDVRHFRPDVVADDVLERILEAAHRAPSVGFSQPWGFVLVRDRDVRARIRESFLRCREAEAVRYPAERRASYLAHKLEGILEAPLNLCVAVDLRDQGEAILGTTVQPEAVRASASCAVQNLWLAARAEGIGVGWVSIVEPQVLRAELALPPGVEPVAYLCVGRAVAFREKPMLEETGWRARRPLGDVVHRQGRWVDASRPATVRAPSSRDAEPRVPAADEPSAAAARAHQARLTKPAGSLGVLEDLAVWYAGVRGTFPPPPVDRAALAIFAADHGVVVEGVSAYGSQVTSATVANVMSGGAAIVAIAAETRVDLWLTDVGIAGDLSAVPTAPLVALRRDKVRPGTANLRTGPAMSRGDAEAAMAAGARVAREAIAGGAAALGLGEIGIGNTTSAAALTCALLGCAPAAAVGRGTGVGEEALARKVAVVKEAVGRLGVEARDPLAALAALGGLEIAAMVGCALESARRRIPVVMDGFVTNAAMLVAVRLDPGLRGSLLAAHASPEPGAALALGDLGGRPLLDLRMRLGEGTGAALALALLRTAVHAQRGMATFATAGVVGRAGVAGGS